MALEDDALTFRKSEVSFILLLHPWRLKLG